MTKEKFLLLRIELKLSKYAIAQLVGVNINSVEKFESGEWPVSKVVRNKLIKHVNQVRGRG